MDYYVCVPKNPLLSLLSRPCTADGLLSVCTLTPLLSLLSRLSTADQDAFWGGFKMMGTDYGGGGQGEGNKGRG